MTESGSSHTHTMVSFFQRAMTTSRNEERGKGENGGGGEGLAECYASAQTTPSHERKTRSQLPPAFLPNNSTLTARLGKPEVSSPAKHLPENRWTRLTSPTPLHLTAALSRRPSPTRPLRVPAMVPTSPKGPSRAPSASRLPLAETLPRAGLLGRSLPAPTQPPPESRLGLETPATAARGPGPCPGGASRPRPAPSSRERLSDVPLSSALRDSRASGGLPRTQSMSSNLAAPQQGAQAGGRTVCPG